MEILYTGLSLVRSGGGDEGGTGFDDNKQWTQGRISVLEYNLEYEDRKEKG